MGSTLVLGTRGSKLALWQARFVARALEQANPGLRVEEKIVSSDGDLNPHLDISALGQTGLFVRRLEHALENGDVDLVVHSLKDLPTEQPSGLQLAAILERHDPRDAILSVDGWTLAELPRGATVATSSPRRRCQIQHARSDLRFVPVRGNIDTRVRKLVAGEMSALILALAGVERLELDEVIGVQPIQPPVCLPAVGQGAIAIEIRRNEPTILELVTPLGDRTSAIETEAERAFLRRLGGGCTAPATAYARVEQDQIVVACMVGDPLGRSLLAESESGPTAEAPNIGARLAERLLIAGADRILARSRETANADDAPI